VVRCFRTALCAGTQMSWLNLEWIWIVARPTHSSNCWFIFCNRSLRAFFDTHTHRHTDRQCCRYLNDNEAEYSVFDCKSTGSSCCFCVTILDSDDVITTAQTSDVITCIVGGECYGRQLVHSSGAQRPASSQLFPVTRR